MRHYLLSATVLLLSFAVALATSDAGLGAAAASQQEVEAFNAINQLRQAVRVFKHNIFDSMTPASALGIIKKAVAVGKFLYGFFSQSGSTDMQQIREELAKIHDELNKIKMRMNDLERMTNWNSIRSRYFSDEKYIMECSNKFDFYLRSKNKQESKDRRSRFYDNCKELGRRTGQLLDGVSGNQGLAQGISKFTKDHKARVTSFLMHIAKIVMRGVEMDVANERMQRSAAAADAVRKRWENRMQSMMNNIYKEDRRIFGNWNRQMQSDYNSLLSAHQKQDDQQLANTVRNFLDDKFYWRKWFVLVHGTSSAHVTVCHGVGSRSIHGSRKIYVASSDTGKSTFSQSRALTILRTASRQVTGTWLRANELFSAIVGQTGGNNCNGRFAAAQVSIGYRNTSTKPGVSATSGRVAYEKVTRRCMQRPAPVPCSAHLYLFG